MTIEFINLAQFTAIDCLLSMATVMTYWEWGFFFERVSLERLFDGDSPKGLS